MNKQYMNIRAPVRRALIADIRYEVIPEAFKLLRFYVLENKIMWSKVYEQERN